MAAVTLETSWSHIFCLESIQTDSSIPAFVSICCTSPRAVWAAHHCQDWDVGLLSQPLSAGLLPRSLLWERSWWLQSVLLQLSIFHVPLRFYLMFLLRKCLWQCYGGELLIRGSGGFMRTIFFLLFLHYFFFTKEKKGDGVKEERVLK